MSIDLSKNNPLLEDFKTLHHSVPFHRIHPSHYFPAYQVALQEGREDVAAILLNGEAPSFENTIEALEYAGKRLGSISNILFNIDAADTSEELQEVVEQMSPLLTAYSNDVMLNEDLFARVKAVYETVDRGALSVEQIQLLEDSYANFVRHGANLSEAGKARYRAISEELALITIRFGKNILDETNKYELLISDENDLAGLPQDARDAAALLASGKGKKGWLVNLSGPSYLPFMQYAQNRALRKELYMAYNTKACKGDALDNQELVKRCSALRLELAQLLGFDCYADFVLQKRMAGSREQVYGLLDQLGAAYRPIAEKECVEVSAFAKAQGLEDDLQAWDWAYYTEGLKQSKYAFSEEDTKPYFELERVKQGVFGLATKLYGIRLVRNVDVPVYHPEVEAFEVMDEGGEFLGLLYTDFHPRDSKQGGAWMTNYTDQEAGVRPHISIVMNFTRPTDTTPALLTFRELETFLHEFGHALHGIFANTRYPSMSGTSVYRDFVELPSQLMENWASEKEFLDGFASHYITGDSIPAELVQKIKDSANYLVGTTCLRQLTFGYLDLAWHTLKSPFSGGVIEFDREVLKPTRLLPYVEHTSISTQLSHIFSGGYAAGYYSYKWAEVLDADAFARFKQEGIFDRKTANDFRREILERGGTEHPMLLYRRFRGQEPSIDALLERSGFASVMEGK